MGHSPEPWEYDHVQDRIDSAHGANVLMDGAMDPDDAKRICACVNACGGISTENLEKAMRGEALIIIGASSKLYDAFTRAKDVIDAQS